MAGNVRTIIIMILLIMIAFDLTACGKEKKSVDAVSAVDAEMTTREMSELVNKANQGDGEAAYKIAAYYEFGYLKDQQKAIMWYETGAKLGHIKSQKNLAAILISSKDTNKQKEAVSLLKNLANAGDASSCKELAAAYERGTGVEKDFAISRQYYYEASMKGDRLSVWNLIFYYTQGIGGTENIPSAIAWLRIYMKTFKPEAMGINSINCMLRKILISQNTLFIINQIENASGNELEELEKAYKNKKVSNELIITDTNIISSENEYITLEKRLVEAGTLKIWQKEKASLGQSVKSDAPNLVDDCPSYSKH